MLVSWPDPIDAPTSVGIRGPSGAVTTPSYLTPESDPFDRDSPAFDHKVITNHLLAQSSDSSSGSTRVSGRGARGLFKLVIFGGILLVSGVGWFIKKVSGG